MPEAQRENTLDEWVDKLPTSHRAHKELAALRLALRVLAMEVVATRAERESFFDNSRYDVWKDCVRRAGEAAQRTDANSLASAEIEAVRKDNAR